MQDCKAEKEKTVEVGPLMALAFCWEARSKIQRGGGESQEEFGGSWS